MQADSAYSGEPVQEVVEQHEMENHVHEKGYRNNPLTDKQKENNKVKSKTREPAYRRQAHGTYFLIH